MLKWQNCQVKMIKISIELVHFQNYIFLLNESSFENFNSFTTKTMCQIQTDPGYRKASLIKKGENNQRGKQ